MCNNSTTITLCLDRQYSLRRFRMAHTLLAFVFANMKTENHIKEGRAAAAAAENIHKNEQKQK